MNAKLWWYIHRETRKNSYYLCPSRHKGGYLLILVKELKIWYDAIRMPWNKKYNARQFPGERKCKLQMLWENLVWAWKYREPCTPYFEYGLDLKGHNPNDYVGYNEFRALRNILNIRQRENLMTNYTFNYLALVRDKFVFYQYCDSLGIPHPKTIAITQGGNISWYDGKIMKFEPIDTILNHNMDAFCKEVSGELGRGAFTLNVIQGKIKVLGQEITVEELKNKFGKSTYIIQEKIANHSILRNIYPNALNTIRINTFMHSDGEVEYYGAQLRFGTGGNHVDNAGQGGFFVGVKEDGTLMDTGYFDPGKRKVVVIHDTHPDTGAKFAGIQIPYWDKIVATAIEAHKFFYGLPSLGWDVAVTEEGFVFTEAGEDWEIQLDQCVYGGRREQFYRTHGRALKVKLRRY